jgi:hypothetical protein
MRRNDVLFCQLKHILNNRGFITRTYTTSALKVTVTPPYMINPLKITVTPAYAGVQTAHPPRGELKLDAAPGFKHSGAGLCSGMTQFQPTLSDRL